MIECVYRNDTDRMVIVKCVGDDHFYREKVVLPTEMFWFEAPEQARLEIWKMSVSGQMLHVRADVSEYAICLLYTSPSPRDLSTSRMPSSA